MVLRQVLQEIESARGQVDLDALSSKLGVERSALEGMIAFWVRKGRLRPDVMASACVRGDCRGSCGRDTACPLMNNLPRAYFPVATDDQKEKTGTPR